MADINLGVGGANSAVAGGYDIANSVKLEPDNAEFLKRNQADGNRKTWTYSMWVKRTELGMSNGMALFYAGVYHQATRIFFDAGSDLDKLTIDLASVETTQYRWITKRVFRDTSAWYHFVWRVDTTQSTATDRMRMYVNGVLLTADDFQQTATFPQNTDTTANISNLGGQQQMAIGNYSWANNNGIYAGYAAQCALVDGESLAPTEFGEFDEDTGIWKPKDISDLNYGTGNNSFLLEFEISSDLGANAKGNDANFTLNNITSADQATDTPTNNFCTFNPLMDQGNSPTITEGAMKSTGGGGNWNQTWGSIGVKNGKWYYEFKVANASSTGYFGASTTPAVSDYTNTVQLMYNTSFMVGGAARIDYYYWQNGSQVSNESTGWGTISTNDVIGIALDLDSATKTFTVYKNGTALSGTLSQPVALPTNMQDEFIFPLYVQYENRQDEANFGGYTISSISTPASDANGYGTFEYAPPSGYYAICTKNLARFG